MRAAERGRQALAAGRPGPALAALDEALRLAPEYVPTRLWTAQALVATHASSRTAQALLDTEFPEPQPCLGGSTQELDSWLDAHAPTTWNVASWGRSWQSCSKRFPSLSFPWGSPEVEPEGSPEETAPLEAPEAPAEPPPVAPATAPATTCAQDAAPRSAWWFDPGSTLLGAVGVVSLVLAYRQGARRRTQARATRPLP